MSATTIGEVLESELLRQRWDEARDWVWESSAEDAAELHRLLSSTDVSLVLRAIRDDRRVLHDVLYLARLGYDQLLADCLDEQVQPSTFASDERAEGVSQLADESREAPRVV